MNIVLYQPDIAANLGSIIRLCACMDTSLHVIEPCGFPFDDKRLRRTGMDYLEHVKLTRHTGWEAFCSWRQQHARRLLLLTTKSTTPYTNIEYEPGDCLLFGRESAGVPDSVHQAADMQLTIPMQRGTRSLNVALAASMVLGEAIRQTR